MTDTIFAVSSGHPPAAIAVLRVSGPAAAAAAQTLAGVVPEPRRATLRALRGPDDELLDRALLLWFPGTSSATGEDLLEIHAHGGRAVIRAIERALTQLPATRRAEPGEFTRRALQNGRLDLAQAGGLADLLTAETDAQRRQALLASEGVLSAAIGTWMADLSRIAAMVEVAIDYDEEGDANDPLPQVLAAAWALRGEIEAHLSRPPVERLRDGIRVVLAGERNVGKSSLFNALLRREAAIASPMAGTTRDIIEASVVRRGVAITLIDTAGLADESSDPIEVIGINRARQAMVRADILLWLGEMAPPSYLDARLIMIHPRADEEGRGGTVNARIPVSVREPESVEYLWREIDDHARNLMPDSQILFDARQRRALAEVVASLSHVEEDLLLVAEHLRVAHRELGEILGVDATEAMLDALFSRFCLGK